MIRNKMDKIDETFIRLKYNLPTSLKNWVTDFYIIQETLPKEIRTKMDDWDLDGDDTRTFLEMICEELYKYEESINNNEQQ